MYKCQECGKVSKPREPINKIISEIRKKEYEFEVQKGRNTITKTSKGNEIVKEIEVCKECYNELHDTMKPLIVSKEDTIIANPIPNLLNLEIKK